MIQGCWNLQASHRGGQNAASGEDQDDDDDSSSGPGLAHSERSDGSRGDPETLADGKKQPSVELVFPPLPEKAITTNHPKWVEARDALISWAIEHHGNGAILDNDGYRAFLTTIGYSCLDPLAWDSTWANEKIALGAASRVEELSREHLQKLYDVYRWSTVARDTGAMLGKKESSVEAMHVALLSLFDKDSDGTLAEHEYETFLIGIRHSNASNVAQSMLFEKKMPYYEDGVSLNGLRLLYQSYRWLGSPGMDLIVAVDGDWAKVYEAVVGSCCTEDNTLEETVECVTLQETVVASAEEQWSKPAQEPSAEGKSEGVVATPTKTSERLSIATPEKFSKPAQLFRIDESDGDDDNDREGPSMPTAICESVVCQKDDVDDGNIDGADEKGDFFSEIHAVSKVVYKQVVSYADKYNLDHSVKAKLASVTDDIALRVIGKELGPRVRNHSAYVGKMIWEATKDVEAGPVHPTVATYSEGREGDDGCDGDEGNEGGEGCECAERYDGGEGYEGAGGYEGTNYHEGGGGYDEGVEWYEGAEGYEGVGVDDADQWLDQEADRAEQDEDWRDDSW